VDLQIPASVLTAEMLRGAELVLVDGHQMALAAGVAARLPKTPCVVDAGSWKPGFERVLRRADYVLASEDFQPPGCVTEDDVIAFLHDAGARHVAVSHGPGPIRYSDDGREGCIAVPAVAVVDTLGAGDILHGAFCRDVLRAPFPIALERAAAVASRACTRFGTRQWMTPQPQGSQ
jgi:sugar/nucleoside kinase (ribokinase family)